MTGRSILFLALAAATGVRADTKIVSKYTSNGRSETSTVYLRNGRQRYEMGKDESLIGQCDRKRMLDLNHKARTYTELPFGAAASTAAGGKVVTHVQVTDTGEKRPMFGFTARHLKTTLTREPAADACDRTRQRVETDGWYIELKEPRCDAGGDAGGACRDDVQVERSGPVEGFPVQYTTTVFGEDGKPVSSISMQVMALETAPLDAALFDVPAGYTEAAGTVAGAAKAPGTPRIGAVAIRNQTGQQVSTDALDRTLLQQLRESKVDAVALPASGTEAAAQAQHCDYLLYTEVTGINKPGAGGAAGKMRGLLRRAPVLGSKEAFEAEVKYRLVPVSAEAPLLESTSSGKTGGTTFNWRGAMNLAAFAGQMALTGRLGPGMLMNPAMMRSLLGPGFGAAGPMTADPMMGGLSQLLRSGAAGQAAPAPNPKGAEEAVAAALHQEAETVLARLGAGAQQ